MATNYWPQLSLSINPSSSSSSSSSSPSPPSLCTSCGSTLPSSNSGQPDVRRPPSHPRQDTGNGKSSKRLSTRRRRETWTRDTISLEDDGFQWRKYGEKVILGQTYPRSYFRCSYRYDQGCLATKQVQRIAEDPPIYRTTYIHNHTCKRPDHMLHHQIIITHDPCVDPIPSFDLVIPTQTHSGSSNSKICGEQKQEWKEEDSEMGKDLRLSIS